MTAAADDPAPAPSGVALTWGVQRARRTGPKPSLTVAQIARAGIGLADRHGLAGVTMAAVAEQLGCTKMALYRYVNTKTDLVHVLFDAAAGRPPNLENLSWRPALVVWADGLLARYDRHPWAIDVPLGTAALTLNQARWLDAALGALRPTALDMEAKLNLVLLLNGHVLFAARLQRDRTTGAGEDTPAVVPDAQRDGLPELVAALASGHLGDDEGPRSAYRWGLDCILDGVVAKATRRARRSVQD